MVKWRKWLVSLIVLVGVPSHGVGGSALAAPQTDRAASHPTVTWTSDGLLLEWHTPDAQIIPRADGTVGIAIRGYLQTSQPGAPQLPFTSTLIALPPGVTSRLHIFLIEETSRPLPAPVAVAPRPEGTIQGKTGQPIGGAFVPVEPTGQTPLLEPVLLEEIGVLRGVHLARLTFYPALPARGHLRLIHRLRAEIRWDAGGRVGNPTYTDPLIAQVRQAVLNPWDAVLAPRSPTPLRSAGGGTSTAFLEIASPGLYRVTYADLESLGFGWADPRNLRLFQGDREVAYEWEGDEDTTFEAEEAAVFYAEPRFSRWTDVDAYRLVADTTPGLRIVTRSADPTGLPAGTPWVEQTFEQNQLYTPDRFAGYLPAGRDGDRWMWDYLVGPTTQPVTYPFSLSAVNSARPATLALWLIGYTGGEHRWNVSVNGTAVGQATWTGKTGFTATLAIPPSVLQSGNNILSVSLPVTSGAWLDAFAVRYARSTAAAGDSLHFTGETGQRAYTVALSNVSGLRAYDVTNSYASQRLTDVQMSGNAVTVGDPSTGGPRRYFVAAEGDIRHPARVRAREEPWGFRIAGGGFTGADMLIVTYPDFADTLGPLVTLRQSQGLTVTVANVLGVYDAYGDGRPDPAAIRAFIANAYATWSPRPSYVLLVGDGSFDPKRYRADSTPTLIPPYLADVDPWAGETAADNRYAAVDGEDALPDLLIGRLPVQTLAEAQTVVNKIVQYETAPLPGGWNANVAFVADDADAAGDFAAQSDIIAATYVTLPFTAQRIYFTPPATTVTDTRQATLNMWNTGALIAQFTGHSSWQQWAAERLFHLDDLAALRNHRRWPIMVEMTCFTGAFQRPEPTLDEELLKLSGGGAVATWGATGLGVSTGHDKLDDGFFRAVFSDTANTVGQATLSGKLALAASGQHLDLLDTFTLLGDPALRLNRTIVPWASQMYLPIILK